MSISINKLYEQFRTLSIINQKELAEHYKEELLDYIAFNENAISKDAQLTIHSIYIIQVIFNTTFQDNLVEIIKRTQPLITRASFKIVEKEFIDFIKHMFFALCAKQEFQSALNYFGSFANYSDPSTFSIIHAHLMYLSYQMKDYSKITRFLNSFTLFANINDLKINVEHAIFYFYKGKIHLRLKEYEKAFGAFCGCIQTCTLNKFKIMTSLQFEALHYIILLNYMPCLNKYQKLLYPLFPQLEKFKLIKEFEIYHELMQRNGKGLNGWISKYTINLKQDKTYGLAQIVLKEIEIQELITVLRKLKRITLTSLAKKTRINEDVIETHLKTIFLRNELNLQYDEIDNILEILPTDYSNQNIFSQLKNNYAYMVYFSKNIFDCISIVSNHLKEDNERTMIEKAIKEADKKEMEQWRMMHSQPHQPFQDQQHQERPQQFHQHEDQHQHQHQHQHQQHDKEQNDDNNNDHF